MSIFDDIKLGLQLDTTIDILKYEAARFLTDFKSDSKKQQEDKQFSYMQRICISFSNELLNLLMTIKTKPLNDKCNLEPIYFSMFLVCKAYHDAKSNQLSIFSSKKIKKTIKDFIIDMSFNYIKDSIHPNAKKYGFGEFGIFDFAMIRLKEYENCFEQGFDSLSDKLYTNYMLGEPLHPALHPIEDQLDLIISKIRNYCVTFYKNCRDDFLMFK